MCASSASQKLRKHERSVAIIGGTVGVPVRFFPALASLELAGAAGILLGLWLEPLGVIAAAALVAYFVGAVVGHLRVRDTKGLIMLLLPLVFSIAGSPSDSPPPDPTRPRPIGTRRSAGWLQERSKPRAEARHPHGPIPIAAKSGDDAT
jgi:hypothetical protein